jgi:galactokinase
MSIPLESLVEKFEGIFGCPPVWGARAPGRVNLIGEHIDYNGGQVLPCAICCDVAMAAAPSKDHSFHLRAENFDQDFAWASDQPLEPPPVKGWPNYFLAVLDQIQQRGWPPPPLQVLIEGDVPSAAGLSSSAAFEVCAARLLLETMGESLSNVQVALLAQAAEHSPWVGVQCGIMDQYISACGIEDHALAINCSTLDCEPVRLDRNVCRILIIHSTVSRRLTTSAYNERRRQCDAALAMLNERTGRQWGFLAEIPLEIFNAGEENLPDIERKRARHVITEQARVLEYKQSLLEGDLSVAGELLNTSHRSLRDDYEVSCPELDWIHETANTLDGVYGCRMTGAGFGGCAVALVNPEKGEAIAHELKEQFMAHWGKSPWTLTTNAGRGAQGFSLASR